MSPPPTIDLPDLLARLDEARLQLSSERRGARLALAFDGDGTLWTGDIGEDFFHHCASHLELAPPALSRFGEVAQAHGLSATGGRALCESLYGAYVTGKLDEALACELMAVVMAGYRADQIYAVAERALCGEAFAARAQAELSPVIGWARERQVEVFVVSASPWAIVEQAARRIGIDRGHVVAALPRFEGGLCGATLEHALPYGPGKVAALARRAPDVSLVGAFGDSGFDAALLGEARVRVAVRPKRSLLARAAEIEGLVTIARA